MNMKVDQTQIQMREMTPEKYRQYSKHSFDDFIQECSETSGEAIDAVRQRVGDAPPEPSSSDLWLLVESAKMIIGYLWIRLDMDALEAFGYSIFIEPVSRGKGLGRKVMLDVRSLLIGRGISRLKICVFKENLVARHLYRSLGFQESSFNEKSQQYVLQIDF
ncbi:MAG: GNAT family N-acetyltransferase [Proteobacteria bacterium]|nr:GNAT family N-acetyltransferase [Pseudomonadota bacterium]